MDEPLNKEELEEESKTPDKSFKGLMFKRVSTLIGSFLICGVAVLFLLTLLIIWLCR